MCLYIKVQKLKYRRWILWITVDQLKQHQHSRNLVTSDHFEMLTSSGSSPDSPSQFMWLLVQEMPAQMLSDCSGAVAVAILAPQVLFGASIALCALLNKGQCYCFCQICLFWKIGLVAMYHFGIKRSLQDLFRCLLSSFSQSYSSGVRA